MDDLDKKILYELDADARATYKTIAKKLREAPETIRFRTERLEENIIQRYLARINTVALGLSSYELFIKTTQLRAEQREQMIAFLTVHPNVAWVGTFIGSYDYGLILLVSHQRQLQAFWKDLEKTFASNILRKDVLINLNAQFYARDYLVSQQQDIANTYTQDYEQVDLDQTDRELLMELSTNARMSAAMLAQKLNISGQTVARHIRNLKDKNILTGWSVQINNKDAGLHHHKILVKLRVQDAQTINRILAGLTNNSHVIAVVHTLGAWDLEIDTEGLENYVAEELLMQLTTDYSQEIIDYDILRVTRMPKYTFYPR
jgi:DNA-binding Lrp family transcriptional regulator